MSRVLLAILLALITCGVRAGTPSENAQLLLMLRTAPAHYRPDAAYADGYHAAGRATRKALARRLAAQHSLKLREDWAMPLLGLDCFVLEADNVDAASRAMSMLAKDSRIESVQPMHRFHVLAQADAGDPLYAAQPAATRWHLAELHRHASGRGIRIAVIDSGVAGDHPDLRGQVAINRNFVDDRVGVAETHGTEVAGIIAARAGNGIGISGIAPQARLLALRGCWEQGAITECNSFTLAKALQFAVANQASVLNLSLAGEPDPLLSRLLDVALQRGITVVAAVDPQRTDGGFPASHPGVLATTDADAARTATIIFRVKGHDVPAPTPGGGWALVEGSSFAAAQMSGLVALVRQRAPGLDGPRIRALMTPAASRVAPGRIVDVDACAVLSRVDAACVCNCAIASATMGASHP
ncbi:S8 family peptidase [Lysobacter tyrosinilyticus]